MKGVRRQLRLIDSRLFSALAILAMVSPASVAHGAEAPIFYFPAEGSLQVRDGSGKLVLAQIVRGKAERIEYVQGRRGKGLYLPHGTVVSLPVEKFSPAEGTLSFWFQPDWSPGDCTPHLIVEVDAEPFYRLRFRKGFSEVIAPDYCYLQMPPLGAGGFVTSFHPENLFTGRVWRHYAIRWSNRLGRVQVIVDGDSRGVGGERRTGKFKIEIKDTVKVKGAIILSGDARGAFDEVKLFDRYLENHQLVKLAGLTKVAGYLQEQLPPEGGFPSGTEQEISYTDPATGKLVTTLAPADEDAVEVTTYNPAKMPKLPVTEHTKWAKPLFGGQIQVLLVMPTGFYNEESMIREGVELWQRLDMLCDMTNKPDAKVLEKNYDVIGVTLQGWSVVQNAWRGWQDLDEKLRMWILDRVRSGKSGLILAYPTRLDSKISAVFDPKRRIPSDEILRGFPFAAMHRVDMTYEKRYDRCYELDEGFFEDPRNLSERVVEVYDDGKVRAVKLNYKQSPWRPTTGFTLDTALNSAATDVHYDYWQALLARAVLFAAGRKPPRRIASAIVDADKWVVTIEGLPGLGKLWYRARNVWGREYIRGERKVNGAGSVTIKGEKLPPGFGSA